MTSAHTLRLILALFASSLVGGMSGCSGSTCSPPAKASYSCGPAAAGTTGCMGEPVSAGGTAETASEVFPVGCVVQLPECLVAYPDEVAHCTCQSLNAGDAPEWVCPA